MNTEKKPLWDRLGLKDFGWVEILLLIMLSIIPFFIKKNPDPFPGEKLWEEIISVAILLLSIGLYRIFREMIKKIIYGMDGKNFRFRFFSELYGKADEPVSSRLFITANLLSTVVPCLMSLLMIPALPEEHFWKCYVVAMAAIPETAGMCLHLLQNRKVLKNHDVFDDGRYICMRKNVN